MKNIITLMVSLICLLVSSVSHANTLQASVSKTKVAKNEVIQLRVVSTEKGDSEDIDFTVLEKDFFISRPSFSSSTRIVNGRYSSAIEWTVSIAPIKSGRIVIPSFTVGNSSTDPIVLNVADDQSQPDSNELVDFRIVLSSDTLYPSQTAKLKVQWIVKADTRRLDSANVIEPTIEGMDITPQGESQQFQSVLDGLQVLVVEQNYHLTARQEGKFILTGAGFTGSYIYRGQNSSTKIVPIDAKDKARAITVKAIPDYKGDIWLPANDIALEQRWLDSNGQPIQAATTYKVGEAITREIQLLAKGVTAEQLPDIQINYPSSVRSYPEKPVVEEGDDGVKVTIKHVLIPSQSGETTLAGYNLSWWDNDVDLEKSAHLESLSIRVEANDNAIFELDPIQHATISPPAASTPTTSSVWLWISGLLALALASSVVFNVWLSLRIRQLKAGLRGNTSLESPASNRSLDQALASQEPIQIQAQVALWLKNNSVAASDQSAIQAELDAMQAAHFGNDKHHWSSDKLKQLISAATTHSATASNGLPPL